MLPTPPAFDEAGEDTAAWYLLKFKALYKHERLCWDGGHDRRAYRLEHSAPLMRELKRRLERDLAAPPPKSAATLEAIQYTLNQWTALERYLQYNEASFDNNPVERALRPTKLGCKSWLFTERDFREILEVVGSELFIPSFPDSGEKFKLTREGTPSDAFTGSAILKFNSYTAAVSEILLSVTKKDYNDKKMRSPTQGAHCKMLEDLID